MATILKGQAPKKQVEEEAPNTEEDIPITAWARVMGKGPSHCRRQGRNAMEVPTGSSAPGISSGAGLRPPPFYLMAPGL